MFMSDYLKIRALCYLFYVLLKLVLIREVNKTSFSHLFQAERLKILLHLSQNISQKEHYNKNNFKITNTLIYLTEKLRFVAIYMYFSENKMLSFLFLPIQENDTMPFPKTFAQCHPLNHCIHVVLKKIQL